jgi:hypothetical protein
MIEIKRGKRERKTENFKEKKQEKGMKKERECQTH